jgi:sugar phosphate isomerase/epimerase
MKSSRQANSRRSFLKRVAMLPVVSAGLPTVTEAAELKPIRRVGGSHLKTSLNAYSCLELLNANLKDPTKGVNLFQVCDYCAEQNFDAVDLTGYFFPGYPAAPTDEYIYKIKRHAFDLGLAISGTGVRNDFTAADKAVRDEGVARIKTWVEVAAKLGAPVIRAFADSQAPFKDWRQASGSASRVTVEGWVADGLRECAEHGKKFGVIVAVQNHGDFIATGAQHISLLERVNHDYCAAMVDTGKYDTPDPYADIAMVVPYAVTWQIKELIGTPADSPRVDMVRLMRIIRSSGYRGYLPIETLSSGRKDYNGFEAASGMLVQLRDAMSATEPSAQQKRSRGPS